MSEEKRIVAISISPELLGDFLTDGDHPSGFSIKSGLPKGARFVAATFDYERVTVRLFFEHESFAPVLPGDIPPGLRPMFTGHT